MQGTVKWFNEQKGYGFITPEGGEKDVFLHISAVQRAGLKTIDDGRRISYEVVENKGRASAENIRLLD